MTVGLGVYHCFSTFKVACLRVVRVVLIACFSIWRVVVHRISLENVADP